MLFLRRDISKNYIRYRVRDPNLFDKNYYSILDIGESGKHKLVRAKLKSTGEYKTQSVIIEKEFDKSLWPETRKILEKANNEQMIDYCPYRIDCISRPKESLNCSENYKNCLIYKLIEIEESGGCEDSELIGILSLQIKN